MDGWTDVCLLFPTSGSYLGNDVSARSAAADEETSGRQMKDEAAEDKNLLVLTGALDRSEDTRGTPGGHQGDRNVHMSRMWWRW